MQGTQLRYAIKFVADMDRAVKFYRDVVGLTLKFESPGWSEFVTGETTLALHPASEKDPAGKVEPVSVRGSTQLTIESAAWRQPVVSWLFVFWAWLALKPPTR